MMVGANLRVLRTNIMNKLMATKKPPLEKDFVVVAQECKIRMSSLSHSNKRIWLP